MEEKKELFAAPAPESRQIMNSVVKTAEISFEAIDTMKKLDLITPIEIQKLEEAQGFILSNYRDIPTYRPMVVKLVSVLNDKNFPTPDLKFWQCGKEAEVHFNELSRDYFKYKRSIIDLQEMDYKIDQIQKSFEKVIEPNEKADPNLLKFDMERLKVQRDQYEFEMKILEKDIKHRIREVTDWSIISKELSKTCQFSTTQYDEHAASSLLRSLEVSFSDPTIAEKDKVSIKAQLDTFKRLLNKRS